MGISRKCYCSVCVCMFRTTMMKNTLRTKYYHFPYLPVIHNHWWGFPWKLYLFSYFHVKYVLPYACDRKICLMVFHILVGDPSDISKAMFYKKRKRATYNKKKETKYALIFWEIEITIWNFIHWIALCWNSLFECKYWNKDLKNFCACPMRQWIQGLVLYSWYIVHTVVVI